MISNLDELARYLKATIPYPHAVMQLKTNASAGGISFLWNGTEFFVKPSFQVLEVRGHSLYITGLSTLLQSVLLSADQSEKRFDAVLESVKQAEDLARVQNQPRAAAQKLFYARELLEKGLGRSAAAIS